MPADSIPGPPGSGVTSPARRNRTRPINRLPPVTSLDGRDFGNVTNTGTNVKAYVAINVTGKSPADRHGRACRGHPRLHSTRRSKTWMAGTSPAMTVSAGVGGSETRQPPARLSDGIRKGSAGPTALHPVILRCPRTARASKDDGPRRLGRILRGLLRSHLRMTVKREIWRTSSLSGHAAEVAEQTGHIDRAGGEKAGHQHLVHRGLRGPPAESPAKHERDSAQESQNLFFGGFISRLRSPARFSLV
jgi:hypothetical protein